MVLRRRAFIQGMIALVAAPSWAGEATFLKQVAAQKGLLFGSSAATWQLSDPAYSDLFANQAGLLFTEDDLLWYRVKPGLHAPLNFTFGDEAVAFARKRNQPAFGAHLVWDEGLGPGWPEGVISDLSRSEARELLFGTLTQTVAHYRGQVAIWSCVNEVVVNGFDTGIFGMRTDVPWMATIGSSYVGDAFHLAHDADPGALLALNDFGYETINQYGDRPEDKRRNALKVLDRLLAADTPVHAFGIQGHLLAEEFGARFDATAYRKFLGEVADRGLIILITELDVLDDGLAGDIEGRDIAVADTYRRYLDVTLDETAVKAVVTFGLSDKYTWLQEDYPRLDGVARRPLPFDSHMRPKPAFEALNVSIQHAPMRIPLIL